MPAGQIEPRYRAVYRAHLSHELRHVEIDWHLIDRYYGCRSQFVRHLNARLFRLAIGRFFLPPTWSAVKVVDRLVLEHRELATLHAAMRRELADVGQELAYQQMMYSRETTPITFALFDRFPEFHAMRRVLRTYQPQ
jgi:hypothetical protein